MNDTVPVRDDTTPAGRGANPESGPQEVSADMLLGPRGVLHIRHRGELYLLRMTRQGKLILTK
jgi:hemin uptake protein HemP